MNGLPEIGSRVRFTRADKPERTLVGTVTVHYPGYEFWTDGRKVTVPDAVTMKPDELPDWWAYPDDDVFCPGIDELEPIS